MKIAETFTKQEWWSKELAAAFLVDLLELANADGKIVELEKEWIVSTAKVFGINPPDVMDKQKNESSTNEQTESTLQKQLADQFNSLYPDCFVKKIDDGNYLDIHLPILHPKKGTHIWFNTPKAGGIKVGFAEIKYIETAMDSSPEKIETYSNGLKPKGAPTYGNIDEAIKMAQEFINDLPKRVN